GRWRAQDLGRERGGDRRADSMEGQAHVERAPLSNSRALRPDRAAMQLDEMTDDRETETEAALRPGRRRVGLPEALEDVRQKGGIDATTTVHDLDLGL